MLSLRLWFPSYLPDFVSANIQTADPSDILTVGSACSLRDEAYVLRSTSSGIFVGSADNRLSSPYCIGILAEIDSGNVGPIMYFLDENSQEIGGITLTSSGISITVRSNTATFSLDASGERYFQICSDGTQLQLFDSCASSQSQPYMDFSLEATDLISLYSNTFNATSTFLVIINYLFTRKTPVAISMCVPSHTLLSVEQCDWLNF